MIPLEELRGMLQQAFPTGTVQLESNDNVHFQLLIVAEEFDGKNMVEQHQMVYAALGDAMREAVHALTIRSLTPAQWKAQGGGN